MENFGTGKISTIWLENPSTQSFPKYPRKKITYTGKISPYSAKKSHFETHHMEKFFRILVGLYGKIFWQNAQKIFERLCNLPIDKQ